jgi:hypothetical protein
LDATGVASHARTARWVWDSFRASAGRGPGRRTAGEATILEEMRPTVGTDNDVDLGPCEPMNWWLDSTLR